MAARPTPTRPRSPCARRPGCRPTTRSTAAGSPSCSQVRSRTAPGTSGCGVARSRSRGRDIERTKNQRSSASPCIGDWLASCANGYGRRIPCAFRLMPMRLAFLSKGLTTANDAAGESCGDRGATRASAPLYAEGALLGPSRDGLPHTGVWDIDGTGRGTFVRTRLANGPAVRAKSSLGGRDSELLWGGSKGILTRNSALH
jgi:hypothetical protein